MFQCMYCFACGRDDAKRYQQAYKEKLLTAKPPAALLEELKVTAVGL